MMTKVYKEELASNLWKCTVCQKEHKSKTLIRDHVEVVFFAKDLFHYSYSSLRRSTSKASTTHVITVERCTRHEIHLRSMLPSTKGIQGFMVEERTIHLVKKRERT